MSMKKTLIVGLGKSGISIANFLKKRGTGFSVCDTRVSPPNLLEFQKLHPNTETRCGDLDALWLDKFDEIIVSPGVSIQLPELVQQKSKGKSIIGDVELFLRHAKAPICAITGSNAKSTVTALVAEMAKQAGIYVKMGGNIGIPVLDLLDKNEPELYVLELSSFQLETTYSLKAKAATILNISPDHMDRYRSLKEYIEAKQRIYQNCEVAVFNRNDVVTQVEESNSSKRISFALDTANGHDFGLIYEHGEAYLTQGQDKLVSIKEVYLSAPHHWENALAALALGYTCEIPMQAMLETLKNFKGLPHRCQLIKKFNGVLWYNDSKGTNEGAAKAAIESIGKFVPGKVILIAGGIGKGADFEILKQPVGQYVSHAILMGEAKNQLSEVFAGLTEISFVGSMKEAVTLAHKISGTGDAVLLSPACASFDMFQNFEKRGEAFESAVLEIVL